MAANGIFQPDERVELVDGEIVAMTPQKSRHATVVHLVAKALEAVFGDGYTVRAKFPLVLDDLSEPEPDVAVVAGSADDYVDEHPTTAVLVVEVSESTLAFDRGPKAGVYARAGIRDYWVVNLVDRVVEAYRNPSSGKLGWSYKDVKRVKGKSTVSPLATPRAKISVASFLR
jgi:Uma2 family endonuclease